MPLYEYQCPNGHDFEKFFRSIGTSLSEAECPICGAIGERRLSTTGLVFKGSGFYITDYGKDGKKAEREAATAEKTKTDAAAATTTPAPSSTSADSGGAKSDSPSSAASKTSDPAPAKDASPKTEAPKASPKAKTSE